MTSACTAVDSFCLSSATYVCKEIVQRLVPQNRERFLLVQSLCVQFIGNFVYLFCRLSIVLVCIWDNRLSLNANWNIEFWLFLNHTIMIIIISVYMLFVLCFIWSDLRYWRIVIRSVLVEIIFQILGIRSELCYSFCYWVWKLVCFVNFELVGTALRLVYGRLFVLYFFCNYCILLVRLCISCDNSVTIRIFIVSEKFGQYY